MAPEHTPPERLSDSPEAHKAGALACLELLSRELDADTRAALRALFDRPLVAGHPIGLKYDFYLAVGPEGQRWGVTLNDRHEGADFGDALRELVARLGHGYAIDAIDRLASELDAAGRIRTFAVGFDRPGQPPRLKLYVQEEPWGAGVCRAAQLGAVCAAVGLAPELPAWLAPDTTVGVVTLELYADARSGLKLYLGADTPGELGALGPPAARPLARALALASPLEPAHYYLTLRLGDGPPSCAVNKIYEAVRLVDDARARRRAWHDVARLFELAHAEARLAAVLRELGALERACVVPTATALEGRLDRVDVYFGVWQRPASEGAASASR